MPQALCTVFCDQKLIYFSSQDGLKSIPESHAPTNHLCQPTEITITTQLNEKEMSRTDTVCVPLFLTHRYLDFSVFLHHSFVK